MDDDQAHRYKKDQEDDENEGEERYQCPETGAHFEYRDMIRRINILMKRRNVIDQIIKEEDKKKQMKKDL
jgi:hypothetical protein